ncbi:MAG TPA: MBL fold metallo-hydrolase, partial [Burkholderiales bacterium]|nr:MBL fold metallo-hydrolase [Burkholderiales bacterium]
MKTTAIGHASLLTEVKGTRIVSDPWWKGPCYGAQWWIYPPPEVKALANGPVDYVYISHGHNDHFHPATLNGTKVLVSKHIGLESAIGELGFEVIAIAEDECYDLGNGAHCR